MQRIRRTLYLADDYPERGLGPYVLVVPGREEILESEDLLALMPTASLYVSQGYVVKIMREWDYHGD